MFKDLEYNPDTGQFTWKISRGKAVKGQPAGHPNKATGYLEIQVRGKKYYGHQLAFLYMTDKIPELVDHINRDRLDNRWCNLREATPLLNNYNSDIQKNNKSGVKFVSWDGANNKWRVRIKMKDGWFSKRFLTLEQAKEVADAKQAARLSNL